jgi:hypothetical protein
MKNNDLQVTVAAPVTAAEAFEAINDVRGWWLKKVHGPTNHLGDEFKADFGSTWVDFKITEFVPGKRVVWQVTDCYLDFINDKHEWNGTSVSFDITENNDSTTVTLTHHGLIPGAECYEQCNDGWNYHFGESMLKLLTEKEGLPV